MSPKKGRLEDAVQEGMTCTIVVGSEVVRLVEVARQVAVPAVVGNVDNDMLQITTGEKTLNIVAAKTLPENVIQVIRQYTDDRAVG